MQCLIYSPSQHSNKLHQVFDAGNFFQVCMRVNEDDENLGYKCIYTNEEKLDANDSNSVFLIDF